MSTLAPGAYRPGWSVPGNEGHGHCPFSQLPFVRRWSGRRRRFLFAWFVGSLPAVKLSRIIEYIVKGDTA